ncbi:MAG: hypothetical protein RLZZ124_1162, partial [Cyanobacteriota bacterium]
PRGESPGKGSQLRRRQHSRNAHSTSHPDFRSLPLTGKLEKFCQSAESAPFLGEIDVPGNPGGGIPCLWRTDQSVSAGDEPIDAQVLGSTEVDEGALRRLLRRAGRTLARPALECLELLLDADTPPQVRLTMLAALTYLLVPLDLIPDFIPAAGFSDDLVALTALLGLCSTHMSEAVRLRAQRKLDRWFPPGR